MQVLEETGFDVSKLLQKEQYLEMTFGQQRVRLYIIAGVKEDASFAPQTKKEISVSENILSKLKASKNVTRFKEKKLKLQRRLISQKHFHKI